VSFMDSFLDLWVSSMSNSMIYIRQHPRHTSGIAASSARFILGHCNI